jgi:hypothetical protein
MATRPDRNQLAGELHELANAIEKLCRESGCRSMAHSIVRNCCDHLRARAAIVVNNGRNYSHGDDADIPDEVLLKVPLKVR